MKEQTIEKISEDEFIIKIIDNIHHLVHKRIVQNAKIMSTTKPKLPAVRWEWSPNADDGRPERKC